MTRERKINKKNFNLKIRHLTNKLTNNGIRLHGYVLRKNEQRNPKKVLYTRDTKMKTGTTGYEKVTQKEGERMGGN
jgi:hypothetical protein